MTWVPSQKLEFKTATSILKVSPSAEYLDAIINNALELMAPIRNPRRFFWINSINKAQMTAIKLTKMKVSYKDDTGGRLKIIQRMITPARFKPAPRAIKPHNTGSIQFHFPNMETNRRINAVKNKMRARSNGLRR